MLDSQVGSIASVTVGQGSAPVVTCVRPSTCGWSQAGFAKRSHLQVCCRHVSLPSRARESLGSSQVAVSGLWSVPRAIRSELRLEGPRVGTMYREGLVSPWWGLWWLRLLLLRSFSCGSNPSVPALRRDGSRLLGRPRELSARWTKHRTCWREACAGAGWPAAHIHTGSLSSEWRQHWVPPIHLDLSPHLKQQNAMSTPPQSKKWQLWLGFRSSGKGKF